MGLFDKKKKGRGDEFDAPAEDVDLNTPATVGTGAPARADASEVGDADTVASLPSPSPSPSGRATPVASRSVESERRRTRAPATTYGIDTAIALMRTLPAENIELVVQVVKHTLESAGIDIGAIIEDATGKQERIEARITVLRDAIAELEREIDIRRTEIAQLESEHRETSRVRERLVLAEKLTQGARSDTGLDSQGSRSSRATESGSQSASVVTVASAPRNRGSNSSPPPPPGSSSPRDTGGSANHAVTPSNVIQTSSGPVVGPSALGPGPSGSFHKQSSTQTAIPKK